MNHNGAQVGPAWSGTAYDLLGRTTEVTGTDGTRARTYYDSPATAVVDANNHQKISVVDAYGRLVTVKEYTGSYASGASFLATPYATTSYVYNMLGNLTRVTDGSGKITTMSYNALGQKLSMVEPSMGAWSYTYDAAGNLLTQLDAKGGKTCFVYDALSRLRGKQYDGDSSCPASYTDEYAYDQSGHGWSIGQRTMPALSETKG